MICPLCKCTVEQVLASEGGTIEESVVEPYGMAIVRRTRPATFYACSSCEWCSERAPNSERQLCPRCMVALTEADVDAEACTNCELTIKDISIMKKFAYVAAFLLLSSPSFADDTFSDKVAASMFAASSAADWISTYRMLEAGGYEKNPALAPLDGSPTAIIAVGAALDVTGYLLWKKLMKRHPKLFRLGLYAATVFRIYLTVHNERLVRKLKR